MFAELLQSSYFALFVIIALGFLLGRVKIKGLSLDISAVIFVALAFGHFGVVIPKEFGDLGLVLFIFTIGIQAGPGFFSSFKSKGKVLIIADPMLATGSSMKVCYQGLLEYGRPAHTHIVSVIAAQEGVDYVQETLPSNGCTLWVGSVDEELTAQSYIVPGLGDAGDLAYGQKLQG